MGAVHITGAGVPCQPFTGADAQRGTEVADGRLAGHAIRITHALGAYALVVEEVKGFAWWQSGKALRDLKKAAQRVWGPKTFVQVLDYNVRRWLPQERERVIVVVARQALPIIQAFAGTHVTLQAMPVVEAYWTPEQLCPEVIPSPAEQAILVEGYQG